MQKKQLVPLYYQDWTIKECIEQKYWHLQLHASQYKQKTQHLSHPLHKHTSTPQCKKLQQRLLHNNIPTDSHTVTTTDIKTNSVKYIHLLSNHHYALSVTPSHTTFFKCTHIRTTLLPLDFWTDLAGVTELLAGGLRAGWSDSPR